MIKDWEVVFTSDEDSYALYIPSKGTLNEKRITLKEWMDWVVEQGYMTNTKEINKGLVYTFKKGD
jgi:hypothetical protein